MQFRFAALLVVALLPLRLFAAYPLTTDDTGTQGQGKFQLEFTTERGREDEDGTLEKTARTAASLAYGLTDNLDVQLTVPYRRLRTQAEDGSVTSASGRGDTALDVKWRFYEKDALSLALKAGVTSATGDHTRNLGTGRSTHNANLIVSVDAEPWEYHLHLGLVRNRNRLNQREDLYHASVAVGRRVGERLKVLADYGTDTNSAMGSRVDPEYFILGGIYSVRKGFDLDFGAKWGLTKPEADITWLLGATFKF